jgi:hypothetical protein
MSPFDDDVGNDRRRRRTKKTARVMKATTAKIPPTTPTGDNLPPDDAASPVLPGVSVPLPEFAEGVPEAIRGETVQVFESKSKMLKFGPPVWME